MSLQKKIATFWKSDSLFQMSRGFPIIKMTAELLISAQSCFLLVPPGLQLCHHVADKVTLCLGWLLEGETSLASTSANRPHTWGIKGQTHYKLDCDYSGKSTQSILSTLTHRTCFHCAIAVFSPIFLSLRSFQTISNILLCPLKCGPWMMITAIWKPTFKSILINNSQQRYQVHRTWSKNKKRWVFLGFILAFFSFNLLKFWSSSQFTHPSLPWLLEMGPLIIFFSSLASSAAFRILFHLYFPNL